MYFDAKFLDGAAVVYLLPVTNRTTFDDYAHQIFIPHVIKQLENTRRVDVNEMNRALGHLCAHIG